MKEKIEQAKKAILNTIDKWKDEDEDEIIRDRFEVKVDGLHYKDIPKEIKLKCG